MRTRTKSGALAVIAIAAAITFTFSTAARAELACVSGHNTVVLPCTFDNDVLSIDSATGFPGGGAGGGHHTLVEFVGPTFTIEADIAQSFPPYRATDDPSGVSELGGTITISTFSGEPLIGDISLELLSPILTGTGTMSLSETGTGNIGPLTGLPGSTFEDVSFAPTSSITETFDFILSTGCGAPSPACTGNAQINGVTVGVSLVPEPSSITLLILPLVALGLRWRRKLL
jgi:hypothetical protein